MMRLKLCRSFYWHVVEESVHLLEIDGSSGSKGTIAAPNYVLFAYFFQFNFA